MWVWLGPLLGVLVIGCVLAMAAFVRFFSNAADAGGVRVSNNIPHSAFDHLARRKLLQPGETVLAYYDATLNGDGSEIAVVTTERLVYFKEGRTTAFTLADVTNVTHRTEPLLGDIIAAQSDSGETLEVDIAPLNDGALFLIALENAWKKKRPSAAATPSGAPSTAASHVP
jgi:hypothetical protein